MNYPVFPLSMHIFYYPIFLEDERRYFGFTKHKNQIDKTIFAEC